MGPTKCGSDNICLGFEGNHVYCYGSTGGCLWGQNDCTRNSHCFKYSPHSPKYDAGVIMCSAASGWPADACKCKSTILFLSAII
jgi:hypothetical protein